MRISQLRIANFKGIKELAIIAGGKNVNIFGRNATNKTTIADAFNWLLNGKDSLNRSDFGIKPIDPETQLPVRGIETMVEATLDLGTYTLVLKKLYYENWVKERGAATKTFKGNTTDYFIDDVPCKKSEYDARIKEIADEKAFKLLTNPLYFNEQLHWTERRKIIIEVCGDITDEDVMSTNSKLAGLKNILGNHDVEQHKKFIAAKKAEINKELEKIPARITEVKNMMPDITGIVVADIQKKIDALQKEQEGLLAERVRITAGGEVAEQNKRLAEINMEILQLEAKHAQTEQAAYAELVKAENEAMTEYRALQNKHIATQDDMVSIDRQIASVGAAIETLYEKYDEVEESAYIHRKFTYAEQASVCPACGQDIPQEKLDAVRNVAIELYEKEKQVATEAFNLNKAKELERIVETGKTLRTSLDALKERKTKLEGELATTKDAGTKAKTILELMQKQTAVARSNVKDVTEMPEHKAKTEELEQVSLAIAKLQSGNQDRLAEIDNGIYGVISTITSLQADITKVNDSKKYKARIDELMDEEKHLSTEYERLEGDLFIIDEFIRTKVNMLDAKINSRFKFVRFKLFNVLINGGLEECCEALINTNGSWTPYSDANAAGRINGGIDIINTLSEHYGFEAPIIIDNAESVVELAKTRAQIFRLVVSGQDEFLRIETEVK